MTGTSNVERERFLADLVHDLRNLLEGIEATLFRDPDAPSNPEVQDMTRREIYDLIRKTETHLDRSRLYESRVELSTGTVELAPVSREAADRVSAFLRNRRLVLDIGESSFVSGDRMNLVKIVTSLLHAASRLSSHSDLIFLSLRRCGNKMRLTLEFPARTISDGRLERLLSLEDDTGLGLGISRALARLQGGDLWWEREEEETRSLRFVLTLPAVEAPRGEERRLPVKEELSILVVDDNADAAESLAMLLSIDGHETEVRHDGRSALEAVRASAPDVVLLDLGLPDIDGYEVCRTLRRSGQAPSTLTLVAVSGRGDDEARRKSLEAGFDAHLIKPIDRTALQRVLARS